MRSSDSAVASLALLIDNTTGDRLDENLVLEYEEGSRFLLSRFAWMRREGNHVVVESPLAHEHLRIVEPKIAGLVASLSSPATPDELAQRSGLTALQVRIALASLMRIAAARIYGAKDSSVESEVPITWEFHDMLFHTRTRAGRSPLTLSKSPLARGPQLTEDAEPDDLLLPSFDLQTHVDKDPPFGQVVEQRRSQRDFNAGAISLSSLAHLLARVMGVPASRGGIRRRFPSGGAIFEIDAVILAFDVTDLASGAYLFRPLHHALRPLRGDRESLSAIGQMAAAAAGQPTDELPPALIVFASRFNALGSQYQGISYSLMLKHVGVLMAMMNLTAPLVGLGSVPLGLGNSDQFAAVTGLDYYRHGAIGEIALCRME